MPLGSTARILQADKQHFRHLNQIKIKCENELIRETKCLEEIFRLEMLHHELESQQVNDVLEKIHHICHRRDAALKRSFETILQRFSFSSIYESETSQTYLPRLPIPFPTRGKDKGGSTNSLRQKRAKTESNSKFLIPAVLATKPMPKARDRYLEAIRCKVSLTDIKECGYLRVS